MGWLVIALVVAGLIACLLLAKPLRRRVLSGPILAALRKTLPDMSQTERDAIEAGSVWWEGEIFSGRPRWDALLAHGAPKLTADERRFIDEDCERLAELVNDWEVTTVLQDLPEAAWRYIKDNGFLGMIIGKEHGGMAFSAYAHSQVVMKLASRSSTAAVSVLVPNSLGPAELLLHYGTESQQSHYLPRLARGLDIPCFALTSPYAGSDAAAIPDVGIVCRENFEGQETLGFRLTWEKRYITLAPIATVLGLAFRARDPDRLLGQEVELGITCALIPTMHRGVSTGRRHWPLNAVFQNGPTSGKNVFIPLDWVIGGRTQIGNGWRMLMECLAAGRSISLPSSNVGFAKTAVRGVSAYAAARRQFKVPIGSFEGVQEPLGRMGGHLYVIDAMRRFCAQAVDLGEKPAVLSAIAKYHVTERARMIVDDGMDILGGKGICLGPSNFLGRVYQQMPISITVEGANILTRSLIVFGQGALRCHPYLLEEFAAARAPDRQAGLIAFDDALFRHARFTASNALRSLLHSLTGGLLMAAPKSASPALSGYYRAATRLAIAFALVADVSLLLLGGSLKRRERLSARLGDALSQWVLISATLKRFEDEGRPEADLPLVRWGVEDALRRAHEGFEGLFANYPNRFVAGLLRMLTFPFDLRRPAPSDALTADIARLLQAPTPTRERLLAGSYVSADERDPLNCGERLLRLAPQVAAIELKLRRAVREGRLSAMPQSLAELPAWAAAAERDGYIDTIERATLNTYARDGAAFVKVDDFPADFGTSAESRSNNSNSNSVGSSEAREKNQQPAEQSSSMGIDQH